MGIGNECDIVAYLVDEKRSLESTNRGCGRDFVSQKVARQVILCTTVPRTRRDLGKMDRRWMGS